MASRMSGTATALTSKISIPHRSKLGQSTLVSMKTVASKGQIQTKLSFTKIRVGHAPELRLKIAVGQPIAGQSDQIMYYVILHAFNTIQPPGRCDHENDNHIMDARW